MNRLSPKVARVAWVALASSMTVLGCADEEGATGSTETTSGGSETGGDEGAGGDGTTGMAPPPGPSAEGWEKAFGGGAGKCGRTQEADFADLSHLSFGDTTIYVGHEQVSGNNQDPIVARFDAGQKIYCRHHEDDGPDGRAVGITWDGGDTAYVVYTVVGGGTDLEGKGGWLGAYAPGAISGGGPKVSYVGRVNVSDGELLSGTFVIAVLSSNKVNTHSPSDAVTVLEDGTVEFLGESAHKPIDANGKDWMDCTDYPFSSRYRFAPDLSTLVCADCTNCTAQTPCP